jgi:hypothetical protein
VGSFGVKGLKTQNSGNQAKMDDQMLNKMEAGGGRGWRKKQIYV